MSKPVVVLTLFLTLFLLSSQVLATSGCCSSHNGVDCSKGSTSGGHVICSDGNTGSSCLYADNCGGAPVVQNSEPTAAPVYSTNTPYVPPPTAIPTKVPTTVPTSTPTPTPSPVPTTETKTVNTIVSPTPAVMSEQQKNSDAFKGFLSLLVMGGGGYWIYRKVKKSKNNL